MRSNELALGMLVQTDARNGNLTAVYFQVRKGKAAQVKELAGGNAFANYNARGQLLGVELLAPCDIAVLDRIARKESNKVRNFFRQSVPRHMATSSQAAG